MKKNTILRKLGIAECGHKGSIYEAAINPFNPLTWLFLLLICLMVFVAEAIEVILRIFQEVSSDMGWAKYRRLKARIKSGELEEVP